MSKRTCTITLEMSRRDAEKLVEYFQAGKLNALGVYGISHPDLGTWEVPLPHDSYLLQQILDITTNEPTVPKALLQQMIDAYYMRHGDNTSDASAG
jgi:hypothetical protein